MRVDLELVEQLRALRLAARDVVEADVADRGLRAVMQGRPDAAVRVEHDQDVLRPPDAQLARGLAGLRVEGLADQVGVGRIRDVDHHHAAERRLAFVAVGAAADVGVVTLDRDGGVHAAVEQRLVADLPERAALGVRRPARGVRRAAPRTARPAVGPRRHCRSPSRRSRRRLRQHRVVAVRGMRAGGCRQQNTAASATAAAPTWRARLWVMKPSPLSRRRPPETPLRPRLPGSRQSRDRKFPPAGRLHRAYVPDRKDPPVPRSTLRRWAIALASSSALASPLGRRGRRPAPLLPDALRLRADLGGLDLRRPLARPGQHRPRRVDRRRRQHEPGRARARLGRRHGQEGLHQQRRRHPRLPRPRRRLGHPLHPPRVDPAAHRGPEGRPGRADRPRRQQRHRGSTTCTTRSCATARPCGSRSTAR